MVSASVQLLETAVGLRGAKMEAVGGDIRGGGGGAPVGAHRILPMDLCPFCASTDWTRARELHFLEAREMFLFPLSESSLSIIQ